MKKITLLVSALAITLSGTAQNISKFTGSKRGQYISHLAKMQKANNGAQQKTTAAMQRINGIAAYEFDITGGGLKVSDSSRFVYSNARGSKVDYNDIMDMDMSNMLQFDTSWSYTTDNGNLVLDESQIRTYTNANVRLSLTDLIEDKGKLINDFMTSYEYNLAGKVTVMHELKWNTTKNAWDSTQRTYYTYNAKGDITEEKGYYPASKQWSSRTTNHFDANGDLDTSYREAYDNGNWTPSSKEIHTYYTNHQLKTNLSMYYDKGNSVWENSFFDSTGYTAGTTFYSYYMSKYWDGQANNWEYSERRTRTVNAQKTPATEKMEGWDNTTNAWESNMNLQYVYNTKNDLESIVMTYPSFPGITAMKVMFYYETYHPTGIEKVQVAKNVNIYPNPATDKIYIQIPEANGSIGMQVVNMAGQMILNGRQTIENNRVEMSLSGMQPGNYQVRLQHTDGSVTVHQVVKQ